MDYSKYEFRKIVTGYDKYEEVNRDIDTITNCSRER